MSICQTVYQPHVDQGDGTILTPDLMLTSMDVAIGQERFVPISIERLSTRVAIPTLTSAQEAAPAIAVIASSAGALISVGAVHRMQPSFMAEASAMLAFQAGNVVVSRLAARLNDSLSRREAALLEQQIGRGPDDGPSETWPLSDLVDGDAADLPHGHIRLFPVVAYSAAVADQWRTIRLRDGGAQPVEHAYQILDLGA